MFRQYSCHTVGAGGPNGSRTDRILLLARLPSEKLALSIGWPVASGLSAQVDWLLFSALPSWTYGDATCCTLTFYSASSHHSSYLLVSLPPDRQEPVIFLPDNFTDPGVSWLSAHLRHFATSTLYLLQFGHPSLQVAHAEKVMAFRSSKHLVSLSPPHSPKQLDSFTDLSDIQALLPPTARLINQRHHTSTVTASKVNRPPWCKWRARLMIFRPPLSPICCNCATLPHGASRQPTLAS